MSLKDTDTAYSPVSKVFHWITALIILALLSVGLYMADMPVSPQKFQLYWLHKSFGILVLMLVTGRIAWRLINRKPADLPTHRMWERFLAHFTHVMLYLLMIAIPFTGWLMSSAGDFPAGFFGLFELPKFIPKSEGLFHFFRDSHEILAYFVLGLIALHAAGAFKHHFLDRDETLRRMTLRRLGFTGGALLAVIAGLMILSLLAVMFRMQEKPEAQETAQTVATIAAPAETQNSTAPAWTIQKENSAINFSATQYGTAFSGSFKIAGGRIFFDPENMDNNRVTIQIDIASLQTGSDDRDTQARSPAWFDTASFPAATFTADHFEKTAANQYVAHGQLTIRDKTLPLSFPFTLAIENATAKMTASLALNRLDFGIGSGDWAKTDIIGNEVKLTLALTATRP